MKKKIFKIFMKMYSSIATSLLLGYRVIDNPIFYYIINLLFIYSKEAKLVVFIFRVSRTKKVWQPLYYVIYYILLVT